MIKVSEGWLLGFPAVSVHGEKVELTVIPGIGGRIMSFGADGINLLYQNERLAGFRPQYAAGNADEMRALREQGSMLLYGGEKTWLAPQSEWGACPYADLDHGAYEWQAIRRGQEVDLILTSPICRETRLQIIRTIRFRSAEPSIEIEQQLINHGSVPVTKGLWQVTMLNRSGMVEIPDGPTVRSEQPVPMFYEQNASARRGPHGWILEVNDNRPYKLGFVTEAGRTSARHDALNGKTYTLTKTYAVETERKYPHGTVVEVYNSGEYPYYELEVHSPAYTIAPSESASFAVRWELAVDDSAI